MWNFCYKSDVETKVNNIAHQGWEVVDVTFTNPVAWRMCGHAMAGLWVTVRASPG